LKRVGVFICECGPNIGEAIDIAHLVGFSQRLENVRLVESYSLLCSQAGQAFVANMIRDRNLTHVVIAACSPREHEATFSEVMSRAGLNPFLLHLVNIREQCAWVTRDKAGATRKAESMIRGAVRRVVHNQPLSPRQIECSPDVLVVGAGVAGLSAALVLARGGRKVYLVEKAPAIGGRVARHAEVFPGMECASCMLDPVLDEVLHHDRIEVLTLSEVSQVLGFYGNFMVTVTSRARRIDADACVGCQACVGACPVSVASEWDEGLGMRKAVYTPYPGAMPNTPVIDPKHCLRFNGEPCDACARACPFGAVQYEQTDQDLHLKVGAIILATGFDVFDPRRAPEYGYGAVDNVYTALEFERLLSSNGPTRGKVLLKNGDHPQSIVFISCVGSRTPEFNQHCSGVCCSYSLKHIFLLKKQLAGASCTHLVSDLCLPGKGSQEFQNKVAALPGVRSLRMKGPGAVRVDKGARGPCVRYLDPSGEWKQIAADMVVLAQGLEGANAARGMAAALNIRQDRAGFFVEEHPKLAPVATSRKGVFIAGCAQGPMNIPSSIATAEAAAGRVLSQLSPGAKLSLEPTIAVINSALCSRCMTCAGLCPYSAITRDAKGVRIEEVLCRGCGVCAAACPSAAIEARHFTDVQVCEEINGILEEQTDSKGRNVDEHSGRDIGYDRLEVPGTDTDTCREVTTGQTG